MKQLRRMLLYWRLALFKVSGKALVSCVLSVASTLNGADWRDFTGTQKFLAIAAALGAMWTVIDAFLDNTMSDLKANDPFVGDGSPPSAP